MNQIVVAFRDDTAALLRRIVRSGKFVEAQVEEKLMGTNLHGTKLLTLRQLILEEKPLSLGYLAEHLGFAKSNATHLIDRLEAEGLVRRVDDPKDRRSVLAEITPEGRRRYEAGLVRLAPLEDLLLERYTEAERRELMRLLARLDEVWG